jgi:protein TonB
VLLEALVVMALVAAFAPGLQRGASPSTLTAVTMTPDRARPPAAVAGHHPAKAVQAEAASGAAGRHADPLALAAPQTPIALSATALPPVVGTGTDLSAGARDFGTGTGAAVSGHGAGAGDSGIGTGGGGGWTKPVMIAGAINSAGDYPIATRDLRIGDYVIEVLTVSSQGRVTACHVQRPSRDVDADAITCTLAMQRFRFRPGTDSDGRPVESVYGWKQSWHY